MVRDLPSSVSDTRHVLSKWEEIPFSEGAILVGIDVESLYTSIPHEWGLSGVKLFLEKSFPLFGSQNEFILEILEFMLKNNFFKFLGTFYQQLRGAPWAPSYAGLHLGLWEEEVYKSSLYLSHCKLWLRYIDDVFMVWGGSAHELHLFMDELNINNRNIRFTYNFDFESLDFLDLTISVRDGHFVTKTFRKKTSPNTLLCATSHHPYSLIQGIPVGQFLRIRRNCTLDNDFHTDLYNR